MARKPRFNLKDHPQYIMQRGHNRLPCFFDEKDYGYFLDCLEKASRQYQCEVHAYCLLETEIHILATPRIQSGISQMMQSLGRRYVQYINHRYHRSGTLWEGRYKSSLIDSEGYLLTCYRYIESLAVDMGLAESVEKHEWSSYLNHAQGVESTLITEHSMFSQLGEDLENCQAQYRDLFQYEIDPGTKSHINDTLNLELVLGGDLFKSRIQNLVDRPVRPLKRGRPPKSKEWEA
jgi:putative transposase